MGTGVRKLVISLDPVLTTSRYRSFSGSFVRAMATLSHSESSRLYSWWWDSHISPKSSKWLQDNLTGVYFSLYFCLLFWAWISPLEAITSSMHIIYLYFIWISHVLIFSRVIKPFWKDVWGRWIWAYIVWQVINMINVVWHASKEIVRI